MNGKPTPPEDQKLLETLRSWEVAAPLPPRFNEGVWRRIAQEETRATPGFWARATMAITGSIMRPRIAWTYAAVLLVLGATAGGLTAQLKSSRTEAALGTRYVQSLDPYSAAEAR